MIGIDAIEGQLRASIKAARAKGYRIAPRVMRGHIGGQKCCCALGSVLVDVPDTEMNTWAIACERLKLQMNEALSIALGFDGRHFTSNDRFGAYDPNLYNLGKKLRAELNAGTL